MSVDRKIYVICGYDLSNKRSSIFTEELCESKLYEDMTYNQRKGKVQCFNDPMSGDFLYAGFILGVLEDDYSQQYISAEPNNIEMCHAIVDHKLEEWGINHDGASFGLMVFNYFT